MRGLGRRTPEISTMAVTVPWCGETECEVGWGKKDGGLISDAECISSLSVK